MKTLSYLKRVIPFNGSNEHKDYSKILILFLICAIGSNCFAQVPMIRLKMKGNANYLDETILYYQDGATPGFDSEYDAYKISGPNSVPSISQEYNSVLMQINGISPVSSSFTINIKTTTNTTGNFTITASDFSLLPSGTCVSLNDQLTGSSVNILNNPYIFNLANSTSGSRFTLVVTHFELPIVTNLKQPTCQNPNAGTYKISGSANAPWNYIWKDSIGTVLQSTLASFESDSLINVSNGNYKVEVQSTNNNCYSNSINFYISQKISPNVLFSSQDTITASILENYSTVNLSSDCESYIWSFGDGIGTSNEFEPNYTYSSPGVFETKLVGTSVTGCKDSTSKIIKVIDLATANTDLYKSNIKLLTQPENVFNLKFDGNLQEEMELEIYTIEGKNISPKTYDRNEFGYTCINLNSYNPGIYILKVNLKNSSPVIFKVMVK
ncbi:MAG: PKD domain-containing protein [Bacteroidota bacterium]